MGLAEDFFARAGVPGFSGGDTEALGYWYSGESIFEPDWPRLAEQVGERADVDAWENYTRSLPFFNRDCQPIAGVRGAARHG